MANCWCGKRVENPDTERNLVLFSGEKEITFCPEHYEQWRRKHSLIYLDGIGVTVTKLMEETLPKIVPDWMDYVVYFPCAFSGRGTYTDKQTETLLRISSDADSGLFTKRGKVLLVINSPFYNYLRLPAETEEDKLLVTRRAMRYFYRPALWILIDAMGGLYRVRTAMKAANKMTPPTWIYATDPLASTKKGVYGYFNMVMHLWKRQYEAHRG